ncbi:monovalent cation/H(+) antiporter subunit G [Rhodococcus antarcticus]|uniref:Monovalent cation/H(+) antiporter subunit G n=1 Tax=Rhodococcus antarcticus TaxID=2987751 RepID=A0ABY6NZA9_9NOCA|nr:monovalent cation/H(+) antiporter subunit G [Rhodococcus antarcticus]UZJ24356.1 monovalent cation/H(+) antiporter subunit G [Rhodococcus antarcticus]
MSSALDLLGAALVLVGALLALAAAIGVLRFPDTLSRMHAATKPQTLGMVLTLLGAILALRGDVHVWMLLLAIVFQLVTAPVVAQRVGQVAYQEGCLREDLLDGDELAAAELSDDR